jgi:hypothetical protein
VVLWSPGELFARHSGVRATGIWELMTVADFEAGGSGPPGWWLAGGPQASGELLAAWVRELLGCPVVLEPGSAEIEIPRWLGLRRRAVPLYWVRRNS